MSEFAIRTQGLTRRFGDLTAVSHLDLKIRTGTIYGFLGPNGSGKTTTIRMLGGLLLPTKGEIEVLGLDIPAQAEALKPRIGYMTQSFSLYKDLSVQENLRFIADIYALPRAAVNKRIESLLAEFYLDDRRRQRAGSLSGGQRQRLALAAATLHQPELLFLDEPTSAVDPQSRRDFWDKLFDLADGGTTILVSTHYMDEAERCHELAILDRGCLAAHGAPRDLMAGIQATVIQVATNHPRRGTRALQALAPVIGVAQIGNLLRVQLENDTQNPEALLRATLIEAGHEAECERVTPSLEDVFVAVTRPQHKEAA